MSKRGSREDLNGTRQWGLRTDDLERIVDQLGKNMPETWTVLEVFIYEYHVDVTAGRVLGPLMGEGARFRFEKRDDEWLLVTKEDWVL